MSDQIPNITLPKAQSTQKYPVEDHPADCLPADNHPYVTVIMPIRNEAAHIQRSLGAVLSQDYPSSCMEVIVVDGMSSDSTKEIIHGMQSKYPNLRFIENPGIIVPAGLNTALRQAKGEILIRVDGHCEIARDYVKRCVQHLRKGGIDCVGGPIDTIGESYIARGIALAMSSSFGVGSSAFRTIKDRSMFVDTVAFPAYTREAVEKTGPFDEELIRNQDDEYSYRLRKLGGKILLAQDIRSKYYNRSSLKSLWRQYYQYGFWKVRVMQKHPQQMAVRQLVPPAFVLGLLFSGLATVFLPPSLPLFGLVTGLYLLVNLAASVWVASQSGWKYLPMLPVAYALLHIGYGSGFLVGLLKFADRWKLIDVLNLARPGSADGKQAASPAVLMDNAIRRAMDIFFSLVGLSLLSPLFVLLAYLIKRDSRGPVFYRGPRVGKNGRIFHILKFRTMYEELDSHRGPRVTAQDDPRITPLGRNLRDSKLNELPQFWNVLVGEMSLVGPRPEDPQIVAKWPEEVQREVFSVRPGITSPASVVYRNEETLLQSGNVMGKYLKEILPSKLRLDQLYVRNRSFLTDLDVLFWTSLLLLPRLKRITIPEHLLYWGPLSLFLERYLAWFLIDFIVAFGAIGTAGVIWRIGAPLDLGIEKATGIAMTIALLFSLINTLMGLNQINWKRSRTMDALDLALSSGAVTTLLFVLNLLWPSGPLLPPSMLVVAGTFAFLGFVAARYRSRLFIEVFFRRIRLPGSSMSAMGERVLIVGSGELGLSAARLVRSNDLAQAFTIIGMVDDDPRKIGQQIEGCKVIGNTQSIPELVKKYDIGLILFSIAQIRPSEQARILALCQSTPARIMMMPEILDFLRALFPAAMKYNTDKPSEGQWLGREPQIDERRLVDQALTNPAIDRLTGLYNRHQFLKLVGQELPRSRRYGRPFSIVVLKIEYHQKDNAGDAPVTSAAAPSPTISLQVLKEAAERTRKNIREVDILGRYDGNEFALALPETNLEGARLLAIRMIKCLTEKPMLTDKVPYTIVLKVGIATAAKDTENIESLLEHARTAEAVLGA